MGYTLCCTRCRLVGWLAVLPKYRNLKWRSLAAYTHLLKDDIADIARWRTGGSLPGQLLGIGALSRRSLSSGTLTAWWIYAIGISNGNFAGKVDAGRAPDWVFLVVAPAINQPKHQAQQSYSSSTCTLKLFEMCMKTFLRKHQGTLFFKQISRTCPHLASVTFLSVGMNWLVGQICSKSSSTSLTAVTISTVPVLNADEPDPGVI